MIPCPGTISTGRPGDVVLQPGELSDPVDGGLVELLTGAGDLQDPGLVQRDGSGSGLLGSA